jgi:hypothetical protein
MTTTTTAAATTTTTLGTRQTIRIIVVNLIFIEIITRVALTVIHPVILVETRVTIDLMISTVGTRHPHRHGRWYLLTQWTCRRVVVLLLRLCGNVLGNFAQC